MTLLNQINKSSPTLADLHVPSIPKDEEISVAWGNFDWHAVHDSLVTEMEQRGIGHVEKTALQSLTESQIHRAFTVLADKLFALGYMERAERIAFSNTIGDALDAFGKVFQEKLEAGELSNPEVDKDDILALIAGSKDVLKQEPEQISKPYMMATLPEAVKGLPKHAQEIWLAAYKSASEQYDEEERMFKVAWAAIKTKYHQVDGRWVKKSDDGEYQVSLLKYSDDGFQGYCYGVVLEPNTEDSQHDVIDSSEIEKAAHAYLLNYRGGKTGLDFQHERDIDLDSETPEAAVVESYISPADFELGEHKVKKGSWVMCVRLLSDELRKQAQGGGLTGYSIKGHGYRNVIERPDQL